MVARCELSRQVIVGVIIGIGRWFGDQGITVSGHLAEVACSGAPVVLAAVAVGGLAVATRSLAIECVFCGRPGQCRLAGRYPDLGSPAGKRR